MANQYSDLNGKLMKIHDNIVDLLIPFRNGNYYTKAMGGSFSIKSVLPALFPDNEELNYHHLNELVQNGGDAMSIFPRIKCLQTKQRKHAKHYSTTVTSTLSPWSESGRNCHRYSN